MLKAIANFQAMRPAVSDKLLPDNMASYALDVDLDTGAIRPLNILLEVDDLDKVGDIQTIYKTDNGLWLHWTQVVNVARVPIFDNDQDRVLYTGTGTPLMTDSVAAIDGGGTDYPEVSYLAGLPAPDAILEGSVAAASATGLQLRRDIAGSTSDPVGSKVARIYTYTYVTEWDEEGPPAEASHIIYADEGDDVTLTNFASMPGGAYQIDAVRIYRTIGTSYLLVAEVAFPVGGGAYVDSVADSALGAELETTLWDAPPDGLLGVVNMANGMIAGFEGNDVYLNEPYQGHAFPEDYKQTMDHDVLGLASVGNQLFVATKGGAVVITGNHPTGMVMDKVEFAPATVSARSIVDAGTGMIYAAEEGLFLIVGQTAKNITDGITGEQFWATLDPETIFGVWHNGKYIGFYDSATLGGGGFVVDFQRNDFSWLSDTCTAALSDPETGKLYLAADGNVWEWDGGATAHTAEWTSKTFVTRPKAWSAGRVDAEGYPVTVNIYGDGVKRHAKAAKDERPYRMPGGYRARDLWIDIATDEVVDGVFVGDSVRELRQ